MRIHDTGESIDCGDWQVGVQIFAVPLLSLSLAYYFPKPQFSYLYSGDLNEK